MPCSSCFTPVFRGTALLHYSEAAGRRPLFPVGKRQREPICGPIAREEISVHGRSACETTTSRRRRSIRRSHRGRSTAAARVGDATICDVVRRSQAGDPDATEALFRYCLPRLTQWARMQMPSVARGYLDAGDIAQDAALRFFTRLLFFEPRSAGEIDAICGSVSRTASATSYGRPGSADARPTCPISLPARGRRLSTTRSPRRSTADTTARLIAWSARSSGSSSAAWSCSGATRESRGASGSRASTRHAWPSRGPCKKYRAPSNGEPRSSVLPRPTSVERPEGQRVDVLDEHAIPGDRRRRPGGAVGHGVTPNPFEARSTDPTSQPTRRRWAPGRSRSSPHRASPRRGRPPTRRHVDVDAAP